jgi:hypothetical protein
MIARRRPRWSRGLAAAGGLALAACAPEPPLYSDATPPVLMTTPAEAGIVDLRGRYRAALCRRLPVDEPRCDDVLLRLPGESAPPSAAPRPDDLRRYRIGLVPGLFSECFQALARPFADVIPDNGSLLADRYVDRYRRWLSRLPLITCGSGTGDEMGDLRRDVRLEWWRRHRASVATPIFLIVTTPRRDHVSPPLAETYRTLAGAEPRNDGMLFWYDQLVSGGRLSGMAIPQ